MKLSFTCVYLIVYLGKAFFMEKFKCSECNKEYDNIKALSMHRSRQHNIDSKSTYDLYITNGVVNTCKCGCGEETLFLSVDKGYREYIRGHASRVHNNWGHNPRVIEKSHETQRKMHESGELQMWNKGLRIEDPRVKDNIKKIMSNPERGKNISKKLTGVLKSDEHKANLSKSQIKSWDNKEKRDKQRDNRMRVIIESGMIPNSKLEDKFEEILNNVFGLRLNIDYYRQFYVKDIRGLFDFKISGKNILIEIDGDYWHCNPDSKFKIPIFEAQIKNLKKDSIKNDWCIDNGYQLFRFWENDINNNINDVIDRLKNILT